MKHTDMLLPLFTRLYHCHTGVDGYCPIFDDLCQAMDLEGITLVLAPPEVNWQHHRQCRCFDGGTGYRPLSELQPLLHHCQTRLRGRYWFRSLYAPSSHCRGALVVTLKGQYGQLASQLQWLALQLQQWQQHFWQLNRLRSLSRCLERWLNLSDRPQLIIDENGQVLLGNQSAQALLRLGDTIMRDDGGQLLMRGDGGGVIRFGEVLLSLVDSAQQVIKMPCAFQAVHLLRLPDSRYWLVMIKDPGLPARIDIKSLACLFSLSRAETEHLRLLARGCDNRQIAEERHVSLETVKTTQRSIYHKTGCHRHGELLLLLQAMS
ncbi:helix-turn-helix transcriptional regulator [Zobellella sp. DQSA1]|uniref:helix-turn-helix transcriptional regulator n=1 Tax=Zobellella sp. DQSA1 TaxID=3342386 RepID=UPI0035C05C6E